MSGHDAVVSATWAERARLVAELEGLEPHQWSHPSLCAGWRVREVLAHMTMPMRTRLPDFLTGMVRARLSFDRYADHDAHATTARMRDAHLLGMLRDNIRHPWRPPGGGETGALSHDVIHGLDITEPLGLPRPPVDRVALVLAGASPRALRHFGVDLDGTRLVATDADVAIGHGTEIRLPATEILLVLSGRQSLAAPRGRA
ncbi:maleylpyruvate isomerase family mycothiol-dependent enzyme [Janibacter cremeus]|uniref:maleylpyruvate isomerase family mycothiol-dependent enzyme n=1 Tax=Janibacter cremeus TaxID=1285192 RepID=UPI0023F96DE0|nr:maleylpyruvate isomerase family mycothiol-dependent enzyme [Janibacter cremeus]WEV78357.1 maleylpyruvate isomerase family mycothiol-dependent enzyme [Janibacter cremeus]